MPPAPTPGSTPAPFRSRPTHASPQPHTGKGAGPQARRGAPRLARRHRLDYKRRPGGGRLTLFVIIGHDAPDAAAKRPQHRPDHLRHLEPLAQAGRVLLAGPFTDGSGSLIVVEAPSRQAVWELVARDPYVQHGVFNRVEVKPFLQVFPAP